MRRERLISELAKICGGVTNTVAEFVFWSVVSRSSVVINHLDIEVVGVVSLGITLVHLDDYRKVHLFFHFYIETPIWRRRLKHYREN